MRKSICHLFLISLGTLFYSAAVNAEQAPSINANIMADAHVCNTESEVSRLAENEQLQEMAKALVEFKATKFCFILTPDTSIQVLERHAKYIKFKYKSQVLYTFNKYIHLAVDTIQTAQLD